MNPARVLAVCALLLAPVACGTPPKLVVPPLTVATPTLLPEDEAEGRPVTRKVDVVDVLHGARVPDPYRWLEDGDADEVKEWTEAQNTYTRKVLDAIGGRDALAKDVTALLQVGYVSAPSSRQTRAGTRRYFHTKREGDQNQPTLYVRDGAAGKDRVLLDTSKLSDDGTTALDWWYPSWDGAFVAWGKSELGSEESELYVRDVATGKDLGERIDRTRHASVAWLPDGKGFFYSRYPQAGSVPKGDEKYGAKIYKHVIGQDPKNDALVFGEGRDKTDVPTVMISPNGRWLVVRVHMGWDKSEVWVKDLAAPASSFVAVARGPHAIFDPMPRNDRLYVQTNDGAPRYRLFAVDWSKLDRASWKEIVPQGPDVLHDVAVSKGDILLTYFHDASSRVERVGLDGKKKGAVELPGLGSAALTSAWDADEAFVLYTSYVVPYQVHRVDLSKADAKLEAWDKVGGAFTLDDVTVERTYATSKDGTKVPMFVIAKKGLVRDGSAPTVLYGYGGFNVNQTPSFSARALGAVRRGAVWVTAILRGGGELGEEWHKAGMLERKQNVFDDFIACAEHLVRTKVTSPDHLGAIGGSNGGLLVAATAMQRPDLFRAVLSLVPLTDMVRYHRFRIAKLWIPEYGDPEDPAHFKFLHAYSPYHHVEDGKRYPAMLFTTAESDSRVDPMHARKMAARVQAAQGATERPILLRVETRAGHGAGKPVSKLADELTDELSFLLHEIGVAL